MSALGPDLEAFFTERLGQQRQASAHTVAAYRDTFCLFLAFAQAETKKAPSEPDIADVDGGLVSRFLDHLERDRQNSARTRNARLSALSSLFPFAALWPAGHNAA